MTRNRLFVAFMFFLILVSVGGYLFPWSNFQKKVEKCSILAWNNPVKIIQNEEEIHLNGIDGQKRNPPAENDGERRPEYRDELGDIKFIDKNTIVVQWILHGVQDVKLPLYKRTIESMTIHAIDKYSFNANGTIKNKENIVFTKSPVGYGDRIGMNFSESILATNIQGRRAFVQYFRDMSDTQQDWLNSGMDAVWYDISDDSRFVLRFENRTNQNEVLINNTVINGVFNEAGLKAEQLDMNSVNWWNGSFYVVDLQGNIHLFTPQITQKKETNRDDLMGNTEPAPELEGIVSERFPEIKKTWLRKVNVQYKRASKSELRSVKKGAYHSQFILRRSLNRLYLLVYRKGDNILVDEPVQLYRVREDGSLKPVKKNRGLKIKGLKHGDRRMYCEDVTVLKLWGYEWKNPPSWITNLVA